MKYQRSGKDYTYTFLANILGQRSTCLDKQVGCIIINSQNEIIASGYNGAPRGMGHCINIGYCAKNFAKNPDLCPSAHAEQNALLQCKVPEQIDTIYLTLSPCVPCIRIIMNTPCKRIVFDQEHKHTEAKDMWKGKWCHYDFTRNV